MTHYLQLTTKLLKNNLNDILIHIAFAIWAILAIIFYQERLYSDSGFYLAKIVHYQTFWIELDRYILAFSQWLPLLFIKLGWPMQWVIMAYSLGHVLFIYVCYLIARFVYHNRQAGWALLLLQTVGILYGFVAPAFELYYTSALVLLWAIALYQPFNKKNIAVQLILLFLAISGHQITAWLVAIVLLFHFADYQLKHWKYYIGIGAFVLGILLLKKLSPNSYTQAKTDWFLHLLFNPPFDKAYYSGLLSFYWDYYKELWGLILVSFSIYLYQKKYTLLAAYLLLIALTQHIVSLTYTDIKHTRYQEQCYFPLIFVAVYPLMLHAQFLLSKKYKQGLIFLIFGLLIYRFSIIPHQINPYTERVELMHRLIGACQEREGNKFVIKEDPNPLFAPMVFTFNMETMLISALNPRAKTVQIIRESEWNYQSQPSIKTVLQDSSLFMFSYRSFYDRTDSIYQHKDINSSYYNFPAGKYRLLNGGQSEWITKNQIQEQVKIEAYPKPNYSKNKIYNILIKIENNAPKAISSTSVQLAYHWRENNILTHWEGLRSKLEIDILPQQVYYQKIRVQMPEKTGIYQCELAWIGQGDWGWIETPVRFEIIVN